MNLKRGKKTKVVYEDSSLFFPSPNRMAGMMDRFKKKKAGQTPEWSRNGSFLNKPEVGWIHPDQQLCPNAGICYGVRVGIQEQHVRFESRSVCVSLNWFV